MKCFENRSDSPVMHACRAIQRVVGVDRFVEVFSVRVLNQVKKFATEKMHKT